MYELFSWYLTTNNHLFVFSLDFNGRHHIDNPHMVITYIITDQNGKKEYQAGWQMSNITYNQWKKAILQLQSCHPSNEFA
jgi:hypothetical protein